MPERQPKLKRDERGITHENAAEIANKAKEPKRITPENAAEMQKRSVAARKARTPYVRIMDYISERLGEEKSQKAIWDAIFGMIQATHDNGKPNYWVQARGVDLALQADARQADLVIRMLQNQREQETHDRGQAEEDLIEHLMRAKQGIIDAQVVEDPPDEAAA